MDLRSSSAWKLNRLSRSGQRGCMKVRSKFLPWWVRPLYLHSVSCSTASCTARGREWERAAWRGYGWLGACSRMAGQACVRPLHLPATSRCMASGKPGARGWGAYARSWIQESVLLVRLPGSCLHKL